MLQHACHLPVLLMLAACGSLGASLPGPLGARPPEHPAVEALRDYTATIHTTMGKLSVRFYADEAPNAVRNFLKLAQQGVYDGARFYCIFPDQMALAGEPTGTGDHGPPLPYEASAMPHLGGTLAMDRLPDKPPATPRGQPERLNSASRFFISVSDQRHLDGDYTAFGTITAGLDIVRRLGQAPTRPNAGRPVPIEDVLIERITVRKKPSKEEPTDAAAPPAAGKTGD